MQANEEEVKMTENPMINKGAENAKEPQFMRDFSRQAKYDRSQPGRGTIKVNRGARLMKMKDHHDKLLSRVEGNIVTKDTYKQNNRDVGNDDNYENKNGGMRFN